MANDATNKAKISADKKGNIQHIKADGKPDNYKSNDTHKEEQVVILPEDLNSNE